MVVCFFGVIVSQASLMQMHGFVCAEVQELPSLLGTRRSPASGDASSRPVSTPRAPASVAGEGTSHGDVSTGGVLAAGASESAGSQLVRKRASRTPRA